MNTNGNHVVATAAVAAFESLTPRHKEVLQLLAQYKLQKEIADVLGISPGTVRRHCEDLYKRLGVHSNRDAMKIAVATAGRSVS